MSYVTYLENNYVVCDIIGIATTDVPDIYVGHKRFCGDIDRFWSDIMGF